MNGDGARKDFMDRELTLEMAGRLPRTLVILLCLGITAGVALVDYWTKQEASINIFYCVPISLAAWSLGLRSGIFASFLCTASWMATDFALKQEGTAWSPRYWDACVLLIFFMIFTLLMARLRHSIHRERRLSRTDALTGACNTRCFHDLALVELDRSRRYGHPFSLAYLDVDDFKQINDRFGHTVGDQLLKSISTAMLDNVRASDVVARLGGDEFCVLFPETGEEAARVAVEKLRQQMISAFPGECRGICSFSIGLVTFNRPPATVEDVIQAADQLMYEVKASTKDAIAHTTYPAEGVRSR